MKTLLRIDASIRTNSSVSRVLADSFESSWKKVNPDGKIVYRDIGSKQIPHLHNTTVQAFYTPSSELTEENRKAIALSDELIAELKSADEIVISSPLYNLNLPSSLKAYFDQVVRVGVTFKVNDDGSYKGLLKTKAYTITTKGSNYKGTPMEALDVQEPYLTSILGFMGIEVHTQFSLEGTAHTETLQKKIEFKQQEIENTLTT